MIPLFLTFSSSGIGGISDLLRIGFPKKKAESQEEEDNCKKTEETIIIIRLRHVLLGDVHRRVISCRMIES